MKTLNILTNLAYPIAGFFGDWITFTAGCMLAIGSGWMHTHKTELSTKADWIGMYAFSLAVFGFVAGSYIPFLILFGAVVWQIERLMTFEGIGLTVLLLIAVKAVSEPSMAVIAMLTFAIAYLVRVDDESLRHALWHVITSIGYYFLI